ncbi:MAG TPA: HAMP domain-containing sensor histidine kinase [Ktedonobacteraceae bacterium]|nr:HAMP domain-containing sensor histidine kinase [Ktedonobacteraceae bacterium]
MSDQHPQKGAPQERSRHPVLPLSWMRSAWFGYVAGLLLVGMMVFFDKLIDFVTSSSMFDTVSFALASVLVALLWGWRPALFTIVIGLIAIIKFIAHPGLLTSNIGKDTAIFMPFVVLQSVAVATAIFFEVARRRILAAQHMTQVYAQELEAANQRLVHMNEQLESANYVKDYVILRSSHELRTPMTMILGQTQMALRRLNKSGETPENWSALRQYLGIVEAHALNLRMLIDDLFDLSSVRAGQFPLHLAQCDLGSLCRDVIEDQRAFSDRAIELELTSEPLLLQADDRRLIQVLVNVVNNAIKYSPENTTIHVRVRSEPAHLIVEVHNEGPALSPVQLEQIFEPFYRTSDAENSPVKGWGLGLAISKEIVERHRGRIWAESAEGKGITFFVKLPISQDNPA